MPREVAPGSSSMDFFGKENHKGGKQRVDKGAKPWRSQKVHFVLCMSQCFEFLWNSKRKILDMFNMVKFALGLLFDSKKKIRS